MVKFTLFLSGRRYRRTRTKCGSVRQDGRAGDDRVGIYDPARLLEIEAIVAA